MRHAALLCALGVLAAALGGCQDRPPDLTAPQVNTVAAEDITVSITIPTRDLNIGQTIPVEVTAENTSGDPVPFNATSGALVYVRVWRYVGTGWESIKRYPETAIAVMNPWTLEAGQSRTVLLNLPVEPDWPTNEPLRLTGEFNGRPKVRPGIVIGVKRPEDPPR